MSDAPGIKIGERKSLAEYAQAASGGAPVCPGCGMTLFANKTTTGKYTITRYEECRNPRCSRRFITKQPHREIVREVKPKVSNLSSSGNDVFPICAEET